MTTPGKSTGPPAPAHRALWALISIYAIVQLVPYLAPVMVPDESSFWKHAVIETRAVHSLRDFAVYAWREINHLGYGSAFWILLKVASFFGIAGFVALRFAALASFVAVCALIARTKGRESWLAVGFALCSAPAWWYGKIVSADTLGFSAGLWALILAERPVARGRVPYAPLAALAFAAGIKPVFAVFLLFEAVRHFRLEWVSVRAAAAIAGGFLLSNPSLLRAPAGWFRRVLEAKGATPATGSRLADMFFSDGQLWDLITTGGFLQWLLPPVAAAATVALWWRHRHTEPRLWMALAVAFGANGVLLLTSELYAGWYWLPTYAVIIVMLANIPLVNRVDRWLGAAIVAGTLFPNIPTYVRELQNRAEQVALWRNGDELRKCVEQTLRDSAVRPRVVVDFIDPAKVTLAIRDSAGPVPTLYSFEASVFMTHRVRCPDCQSSTGGPLLLAISRRARRQRPWSDVLAYTRAQPDNFLPARPLRALADCQSVQLFVMP